MSKDTVIAVENVSKAYRIWEKPTARLTAPLLEKTSQLFLGDSPPARGLRQKAANRYRDFRALNDIAFEVRKGESIGIIGPAAPTLLGRGCSAVQRSHPSDDECRLPGAGKRVDTLIGYPSKADKRLGREPQTRLKQPAQIMVEADIELARRAAAACA